LALASSARDRVRRDGVPQGYLLRRIAADNRHRSLMNSRHLLIVIALGLGPMAAAQPPPVAVFAAPPAMQSPSISPDGARIAFIAHTDQGTFVYASQLASNQADAVVRVDDKARAVSWTNNDTLLLLASEADSFAGQMTESFGAYGIDLAGELSVRRLSRSGGTRAIGGGSRVQGDGVIAYQRATGRVLFSAFESSRRVLYAVDAKNDRPTELEDGPRLTRDWVVDENGTAHYRVEYTDNTDRLRILRRNEGGWQTFAALTMDVPELDVHGLDADGELVVGVRPLAVGRYGLYVVSEEGTLDRALYAHDSLDVSDVRIDPYTNRVVGASVESESPVWFDAGLAMQQASLDEAFPDELPRIVNWSQDRSRFIVRTERDDRARAFYLYDANERTATLITSTYPALESIQLPARSPYTYTARDGIEIPGYLTRPLGVDGPAPLVVLPHSGPAIRDVDGFDWLAHFLASRGYAVLQPNFRGSDGYGRAWEEAGYGGWGIGVMQHDLTDGVAAVVAARIADPERICIVGASYGGYAALAGVAFTPELYRCAVAFAGVSELRDMLMLERRRRGDRNAAVTYWRRSMGVEDNYSARELDAASPALHAERVQAPVLLIHGRDDAVVPIGQSRMMERALRAAGKPVQFLELEGEDHWLSVARTRLETLQAIETFLAQHLSGDALRSSSAAIATPE
jgi:dipeptidyl aminopeptidase/acylaminoacyl peptidase